MKQLLLLATATLVFTLLEQGNTSSATGQAGTSETKSSMHDKANTKLTGCLTTEGQDFVLIHDKKKVEIQSAQNLGAYTGHQVSLEGKWNKSDTAQEGDNTKGGKEGGTKGRRLFTATKIENISDSCPDPS